MRLINADEILNVLLKMNQQDNIKIKDMISLINVRNTVVNIQDAFDNINTEIQYNQENLEYIDGLEYAKKCIKNATYREIHNECSWCKETN